MERGFSHLLNSSTLRPKALQLSIDGLSLAFRGVQPLRGVSFDALQGEITSVIGPNGAGKTSLLNCINGLYHPHQGRIQYYNEEGSHDLTRLRSHEIARLGIARTFQNIELFKQMTVLDNLMLGRHLHMHTNWISGGLYWGSAQREETINRRFIEDIIDLLEIEAIRAQRVGTLAYGLQKRVEMGRALALQPSLLLLDEPMAGMSTEEKEDMARFILDVNQEHGLTIIIVEHDMGVVMDISDHVIVLDFGVKIGDGTADEVQQNPDVIRAYLGES